jgi:hypothetical protein
VVVLAVRKKSAHVLIAIASIASAKMQASVLAAMIANASFARVSSLSIIKGADRYLFCLNAVCPFLF